MSSRTVFSVGVAAADMVPRVGDAPFVAGAVALSVSGCFRFVGEGDEAAAGRSVGVRVPLAAAMVMAGWAGDGDGAVMQSRCATRARPQSSKACVGVPFKRTAGPACWPEGRVQGRPGAQQEGGLPTAHATERRRRVNAVVVGGYCIYLGVEETRTSEEGVERQGTTPLPHL
jgi:hypothetical protein